MEETPKKNIYERLLEDLPSKLEEILKMSQNQTFISEIEIKDTINSKFDNIKQSFSEETDFFLEEVTKNLPESSLSSQMKQIDNDPSKRAQEKIKDLMSNLEKMIEAASVNEDIINYVKNTPIEKLFKYCFKTDRYKFRPFSLKGHRLFGNSTSEATWDETLAKRNTRGRVLEDGRVLDINSTSCWNFFATKERFSEGIVKFCINVENLVSDAHFYIGMVNTSKDLNVNSGCLCCSNPNSFYYDRSGTINANNAANVGKIATKGRKTFKAQVEADFDAKTVVFTEEEDNSIPIKLEGTEFRFLVGCCNSCTAKVTILDYILN